MKRIVPRGPAWPSMPCRAMPPWRSCRGVDRWLVFACEGPHIGALRVSPGGAGQKGSVAAMPAWPSGVPSDERVEFHHCRGCPFQRQSHRRFGRHGARIALTPQVKYQINCPSPSWKEKNIHEHIFMGKFLLAEAFRRQSSALVKHLPLVGGKKISWLATSPSGIWRRARRSAFSSPN